MQGAQLAGHQTIYAEVIGTDGRSLGESEVPIESLRSPKSNIRLTTSADHTRWDRVRIGAAEAIPVFPPVIVQLIGDFGTPVEDVSFDTGTIS